MLNYMNSSFDYLVLILLVKPERGFVTKSYSIEIFLFTKHDIVYLTAFLKCADNNQRIEYS